MKSNQWRDLVGRLIKSEMHRKKLRYEDISQLLAEKGIYQTAANLRNKINRGILGADLLIQLIYVMDIQELSKSTLQSLVDEIDGD